MADKNGAGIRCETGNLVVTNSYFHDNENGLLSAADANGTITIKNSEFGHNGNGNGLTHNIYVGAIKQLTIQDSYIHDAVIGHEVKSRALNTTITGSRIQNNSGNASYEIDLPQGGNALIQGNLIQQGTGSSNPVIIAFGEEGRLNAGSNLLVRGNIIVNDKTNGVAVRNATNSTGDDGCEPSLRNGQHGKGDWHGRADRYDGARHPPGAEPHHTDRRHKPAQCRVQPF